MGCGRGRRSFERRDLDLSLRQQHLERASLAESQGALVPRRLLGGYFMTQLEFPRAYSSGKLCLVQVELVDGV